MAVFPGAPLGLLLIRIVRCPKRAGSGHPCSGRAGPPLRAGQVSHHGQPGRGRPYGPLQGRRHRGLPVRADAKRRRIIEELLSVIIATIFGGCFSKASLVIPWCWYEKAPDLRPHRAFFRFLFWARALATAAGPRSRVEGVVPGPLRPALGAGRDRRGRRTRRGPGRRRLIPQQLRGTYRLRRARAYPCPPPPSASSSAAATAATAATATASTCSVTYGASGASGNSGTVGACARPCQTNEARPRAPGGTTSTGRSDTTTTAAATTTSGYRAARHCAPAATQAAAGV